MRPSRMARSMCCVSAGCEGDSEDAVAGVDVVLTGGLEGLLLLLLLLLFTESLARRMRWRP